MVVDGNLDELDLVDLRRVGEELRGVGHLHEHFRLRLIGLECHRAVIHFILLLGELVVVEGENLLYLNLLAFNIRFSFDVVFAQRLVPNPIRREGKVILVKDSLEARVRKAQIIEMILRVNTIEMTETANLRVGYDPLFALLIFRDILIEVIQNALHNVITELVCWRMTSPSIVAVEKVCICVLMLEGLDERPIRYRERLQKEGLAN